MSHQAAPGRVGPVYRISRALILFVYGFAIACSVKHATAFFLPLFNANTRKPIHAYECRHNHPTADILQQINAPTPAARNM